MKVLVIDPDSSKFGWIGTVCYRYEETKELTIVFEDFLITYRLKETQVVEVNTTADFLPSSDPTTTKIVQGYRYLAQRISLELSGQWIMHCVALLSTEITNEERNAIDMRYGLWNGEPKTPREVAEATDLLQISAIDAILDTLKQAALKERRQREQRTTTAA